jgi:signal transduction histidine kinase
LLLAINFLIGRAYGKLPWETIRISLFNATACAIGICYFLGVAIAHREESTHGAISIYAIVTTVALFILNRRGLATLTRILWVLNATVIVSMYYITITNVTFYFHYITLAIISFVIFDYSHRKYALLVTAIILGCFLASSHYVKETYSVSEVLASISHADYQLNFLMCFVVNCAFIYLHVREKYFADLLLKTEKFQQSVLKTRLRNEEQKYSLVARASGAMLVELHFISRRAVVDNAFFTFAQIQNAELTIEDILAIIHSEDKTIFGAGWRGPTSDQTPQRTLEIRIKSRQGNFRWVSVTTVLNNENKILLISLVDIHNNKIIQDRIISQNHLLAKMNAELDNFVYHTSHDIRSPICSIIGLTNLASGTNETDELRLYVKMIDERAKALDQFVQNVMIYSNNTRDQLFFEAISLKELVNEVWLSFTGQMKGMTREGTIHVKAQDQTVVVTDRQRLTIILTQLISNSITFSKPGTIAVSINFEEFEDRYIIGVSDNGIGVHHSYISRVFDMFYRASESAKGSGLGLYIVKEVVAKLDGDISISSVLGQGTSVVVTLPKRQISRGVPFTSAHATTSGVFIQPTSVLNRVG